jgi:hypothetical protein
MVRSPKIAALWWQVVGLNVSRSVASGNLFKSQRKEGSVTSVSRSRKTL